MPNTARWILSVVLLGHGPLLAAASFDCAKAKTAIEKTICGDSRLSEADERLGGLYARLLANRPKPEADQLRQTQIAWLRERNLCLERADALDCLLKTYQKRLTQLSESVSSKAPPAPADARLRLTTEGLGSLNRDSPFNRNTLTAALPGYVLKEEPTGGSGEIMRFYRQDKLALEIHADAGQGRIGQIVVWDSAVTGPFRPNAGTTLRDVSGQGDQLPDCEAGMDRLAGFVLCGFAQAPRLRYIFKPINWNGPRGDIPPRAVLQQAELIGFVWLAQAS